MTPLHIPAPDFSSVAVGPVQLHLLEAAGFSEDSTLLLIRGTYTDSVTPGSLQYGWWCYDLKEQAYVQDLMRTWQGAGVDILQNEIAVSGQIRGQGADLAMLIQFRTTGQEGIDRIAVFSATAVTDPDLIASIIGPDISLRIERFAVSGSGRFVAIQTDSSVLASERQLDTNDLSDIYLLDRLAKRVDRVSLAGNAELIDPVRLGNVFESDGVIRVGLSTPAALTSSDKHILSDPVDQRTDAYAWSSAFDASGLIGTPSFFLASFKADGVAAGRVSSDAPVILTSRGVVFTSSSGDLVVNDNNQTDDVFISSLAGGVVRIPLAGTSELPSGAILLGANFAGSRIALLTDSAAAGLQTGLPQALLVNTDTGAWELSSQGPSGTAADDLTLNGSVSPRGDFLAFSTAATNLGTSEPVASQGDLFVARSGLSTKVAVQVYDWRSHALLDGVDVVIAGSGQGQTVVGSVELEITPGQALSLLAGRTPSTTEPAAVNLQDAIAILKMIVGLPVNGAGQPLSPYQSLAADFDGNGSVTLTDAIGVLKHVVGLPAPAPRWMFAHEADLTMPQRTGLAPERPVAQGGPGPVNLDDVTPYEGRIGLVGVLRGDVDGSWRAPVGTGKVADNPVNYFTELANRLDTAAGADRFNPSQWGVYGG